MSAQPVLFEAESEVRHGAAQYVKGHGRARGEWHIAVKPYVMILLKRVFPRARSTSTEVVILAHSRGVAAELVWFMQRYDLAMSPADRTFLQAEAGAHHAKEAQTQAILAGARLHGEGFREMAEQTLRDYQQIAADLISNNKRVLIGDALGLGKTLTGLSTLRNPDALPALLVVPTHLPHQWEAYCNRVWPDLTTHIARKGKPYDMTRYGGPADVLILNYAKLAGWRHELAGAVQSVIFDEAQELRRGNESEKGMAAEHIAAEATYAVGLTATPIYNYGDEIHSLMNVLAPGSLGNRDEFLREWGGHSWETQSGAKHATVKNPKALGMYLRDTGLMLARTRTEVGRELPYGEPEKVPHVIDADTKVLDKMVGNAAEMARLILDKSTDARTRFQTSGEFDMRVRQATGLAKAPFVAAFVEGLLESEERVVLWGWHHAVYNVWAERLAKYGVARYTGHESQRQRRIALARFTGDLTGMGVTRDEVHTWDRQDQRKARVLIMSLRSGAGIDGLQQHCNVGVFGELDWSPKVHDQCLGRLARDGQENEVIGYYLMADHGSDPEMAGVLEIKQGQAAPIENPHTALVRALPHSATSRVQDLARSILRQHGEEPPDDPEPATLTVP